jgi:hypothetical protein
MPQTAAARPTVPGVVRALLFPLLSLLLVLWVGLGVVAALGLLLTDCSEAASEIRDPCALGKGTALGLGFLLWLVLALPLALAWVVCRPRRRL